MERKEGGGKNEEEGIEKGRRKEGDRNEEGAWKGEERKE